MRCKKCVIKVTSQRRLILINPNRRIIDQIVEKFVAWWPGLYTVEKFDLINYYTLKSGRI